MSWYCERHNNFYDIPTCDKCYEERAHERDEALAQLAEAQGERDALRKEVGDLTYDLECARGALHLLYGAENPAVTEAVEYIDNLHKDNAALRARLIKAENAVSEHYENAMYDDFTGRVNELQAYVTEYPVAIVDEERHRNAYPRKES